MTRIRPVLVAFAALSAACGGSEPVAPPTPTVASVTVTPASSTLEIGAATQFIAAAKDAAGSPVTGLTVTWSSSTMSVATISTAGLATAVGAGTSAITATVGGVAGSAVLTVAQSQCSSPKNVSLTPGQAQSFAATDCLLLPSGASGDRYRVVVMRPTETANAADVVTATLKVVGLGVSQAAAVATPAAVDAGITAGIPGFSREAAQRAIRVAEATEQYHVHLRRQEEQLMRTAGARALVPVRARPTLLRSPQSADSPAKITLDTTTGSGCTTTPESKVTALKILETDDLVFYQDSTQNATKPLTAALAGKMATYYTAHAKQMIIDYFGAPSDIDENGKVLVFVSPVVKDDVAAFVWSGDFFTASSCAASNEREIIYFNLDLIQDMDASPPGHQALETLAHEMKHVVSLYHRIIASQRLGGSQYHPTWIEEGTAEIAGEMSSRIAWAKIGGPAVGAEVTRQSFVNTSGGIVAENYGVAIKLARTAWYLSSQPNGLVVEPDGAVDGASIYGSGWLFHRWLGDAYGNAASSPQKDASFFYALNDSLAPRGTAGLAVETGKSFLALLDEFTQTVLSHKTATGTVPRNFSTYDFVAAAEIFCNPNPLGVFPWPVTTTGTPGDCDATPRVTESSNPSASFRTATYAGPIGASGLRVHDFLSNGTGTGAQIQLDMAAPAKMMVVRIR
jgi:hypothetical protein